MIFYVGTVTGSDGDKRTFVVKPGAVIVEDKRTPEQIERDAWAAGHDVTFCDLWGYGVPYSYRDEIVNNIEGATGLKLFHGLEIELTHRIRVNNK